MAQLPFAITPVAAAAGPDTTHAMHALRGAADAAHRKVLWISPSQAQANQARADDLADTTATLSDAHHHHLTTNTWQLPAGSMVILEDAALTPTEPPGFPAAQCFSARLRSDRVDGLWRWKGGPGLGHRPGPDILGPPEPFSEQGGDGRCHE